MDQRLVIIDLPKGGTMELHYTPLLEAQVRERYALGPDEEVTTEILKDFLTVELASALRKENEDA